MSEQVPTYVLHANEGVLVPVRGKNQFRVRKLFAGSVAALFLGSILFRSNLFAELSFGAQMLLIALAAGVWLRPEPQKRVASPIELRFYGDYFVLYRPDRYYSRRVSRKEICYMKYCDVTRCVYKSGAQRIHIYGGGVSEFYRADKNGRIPEEPTEIRHYKDGVLFFNTSVDSVDFKREIEEHSPIRVVEEAY